MRRVYTTPDQFALTALRAHLDAEGIESIVLNQNVAGLVGGIPVHHGTLELWVTHDTDALRARELINRFEMGDRRAAACGQAWRCPSCGQMIEGQFTECWNCTLNDEDDPRKNPHAKCPECGYSLYRLPQRRCPECGASF